jgi:SAM-dependent methyltransferase
MIQQLGFERNPEKPYSDPRVVREVNDARAYLRNTTERFDLVVSSILDSHVTQSSFTNIRTDNYVYTREGIESMLRVLKPDGVLSVSFSAERTWFGGRMRNTLASLLGKTPRVLYNGYFFFLIGDAAERQVAADPDLAAFLANSKQLNVEDAPMTTDDWPYFYHRDRGVPTIVIVLSVLVIVLCWLVLRGNQLRLLNLRWHFFFLGAGFMLMEVQIISKLALLFGTTWLVNAIAISALLGLILLANAVAARVPAMTGAIAYVGLFAALAVCYLVPLQALLFESFWLRAVLSTLLLCSPVFFAGLIFISSFAQAKFSAEAFGSNLFGSVIGGLLEALSFWTGIRSLLIVAGICYLLSWITRKEMGAQAGLKTTPATAD